MVISYREEEEEEERVRNEESVSVKGNEEIDRIVLFRKMKRKIIDLQSAVCTVNEILEGSKEAEDKLCEIGQCVSYWKPGNNFHEVEGELNSKASHKT